MINLPRFPGGGHTHPAEVIAGIKPADLAGLKIVFINMPLRETAVPNTTPEGPLLMATNLRKNYGVYATVIDLNAYRIKDELAQNKGLTHGRHLTPEETFELIQKHFLVHGEPDVVALSGMITTLRWQEAVTKMIRTILPDVFLVSGGGLATELKAGLFNYISGLDAVAHSEGDDVVVKICFDAQLIKRKGFNGALLAGNLEPYYLGYTKGRHRLMYAGDRPRDLDSLPFADLDLLAEDVNGHKILDYYLGNDVWGIGANNSSATPFQMTRSTTSVSSRGCPFACQYCYRGAQGERKWGVRSAEHIYKEMLHHQEKYGIDFKGFPDDNFAVTIGRIVDLVPLLGPLGIRWGTHTRLDEAAGLKPISSRPGEYVFEDPHRIELMAKAGCVYIGFGPESANKEVLEAIGKGGHTLTNGFVPKVVNGKTYNFARSMIVGIENCLRFGIHSNCTWIMALPTENLERLKESVAFIKWHEDLYIQNGLPTDSVNKKMFTLTWYPGTEIIRHTKVRQELTRVFGVTFNERLEPICDEKFYKYLIELDDATKVLYGNNDEPLNFGDMPMDQFLQAREYVDSDQIFKILEM
ncbi:MAG: radical SAM protein [bacterium]|nr:radical SAM protein [bacterium]